MFMSGFFHIKDNEMTRTPPGPPVKPAIPTPNPKIPGIPIELQTLYDELADAKSDLKTAKKNHIEKSKEETAKLEEYLDANRNNKIQFQRDIEAINKEIEAFDSNDSNREMPKLELPGNPYESLSSVSAVERFPQGESAKKPDQFLSSGNLGQPHGNADPGSLLNMGSIRNEVNLSSVQTPFQSTAENSEVSGPLKLVRRDGQKLKPHEALYPGMAYDEYVHQPLSDAAEQQAKSLYPDFPKPRPEHLPPVYDKPEDLQDPDYFDLPDNPTLLDPGHHGRWLRKKARKG
jgi:hypothetical protein